MSATGVASAAPDLLVLVLAPPVRELAIGKQAPQQHQSQQRHGAKCQPRPGPEFRHRPNICPAVLSEMGGRFSRSSQRTPQIAPKADRTNRIADIRLRTGTARRLKLHVR